jgi:hypothetical protein
VIAPTADEARVADWDSTSYTVTVPHCLRRVDTNLYYPNDLNDDVHQDGPIWSRALWDIRNAVYWPCFPAVGLVFLAHA